MRLKFVTVLNISETCWSSRITQENESNGYRPLLQTMQITFEANELHFRGFSRDDVYDIVRYLGKFDESLQIKMTIRGSDGPFTEALCAGTGLTKVGETLLIITHRRGCEITRQDAIAVIETLSIAFKGKISDSVFQTALTRMTSCLDRLLRITFTV